MARLARGPPRCLRRRCRRCCIIRIGVWWLMIGHRRRRSRAVVVRRRRVVVVAIIAHRHGLVMVLADAAAGHVHGHVGIIAVSTTTGGVANGVCTGWGRRCNSWLCMVKPSQRGRRCFQRGWLVVLLLRRRGRRRRGRRLCCHRLDGLHRSMRRGGGSNRGRRCLGNGCCVRRRRRRRPRVLFLFLVGRWAMCTGDRTNANCWEGERVDGQTTIRNEKEWEGEGVGWCAHTHTHTHPHSPQSSRRYIASRES